MNKTKLIGAGLFLVLVLVAYGYFTSGLFKRKVALVTGDSEICIDGVTYIQFISGASVKYDTDGTIHRCDE